MRQSEPTSTMSFLESKLFWTKLSVSLLDDKTDTSLEVVSGHSVHF